HANAWSTIHSANVTGILVTDSQTKHISKDLESMLVSSFEELDLDKLDVVDVCVPVDKRAEWIERAAAKKVPVICELPLGQTQGEILSAFRACKENGVHCYPGNGFHFAPMYANAKTQIKNGALGKPGVIRLSSQLAHPGGTADIFAALGVGLFSW